MFQFISKSLKFGILFLFLVPAFAFSQKQVDLNKLDEYFNQAFKDWKVPGMAIGIVKNDSLIFAKGYGLRDVEKTDKVDANTLFAIASNTKAFTSAALATLIEDEKLKWNDSVIKFLPYFELYDSYVTKNLTIADMLSHRTGLETFSGDLLWYGSNYSREEVIRRAKYLKQARSFRTSFGYSNIMYIAAGEIIQKVTGKKWEDYISETFLKPLGMNDTKTSITQLDYTKDVAMPHTFFDNKMIKIPYLNWDNVAPAGSILSSVNDMSKWIKLQLNHGTLNGKQYFNETSSRQMWTPYVNFYVNDGSEKLWPTTHFKSYGLGWGLMDLYGKKIVSHTGGYDGMLSTVCLIPEEKLGFVILTNANEMLFYSLYYKILDAFLSDSNADWSKYFLDRDISNKKHDADDKLQEEKDRDENEAATVELKEFCGTYKSELYGEAKVTLENKDFKVKMVPSPLFVGDLTHWQGNTFKVVFKNFPSLPYGKVNFILNAM
ncbi:MAG: serine hydrolase, partial [Bacteroidetes bacterium]|nr:serine hydrolase [Bacteroidota bacterium]